VKRALLLASVTAVLACGRPHPGTVAGLDPIPSGAAQVCVVRPETTASGTSMPVRDNGRLVGATRGTTFMCWIANAGAHQLTSDDDDTGPLLFHAKPGGRYWIHQEVVELGGQVHAHLDWVDESIALEMIESCETRVYVSVPGHDDNPGALPIAPASKM
jgi:hypothetical protein